jgi:hypothetical protein
MDSKRRGLLYWMMFFSFPCFAAEGDGYQSWLELKDEFAGYAGGAHQVLFHSGYARAESGRFRILAAF